MTCIVGIAHAGKVVMAGDSAGTDSNWIQVTRADRKIVVRHDIEKGLRLVFGFCGCYRSGQLLRHELELPAPPEVGDDVSAWLVTKLIPNVRRCFRNGGVLKKENEVLTTDAPFLLAFRGRLFSVGTDLQVGEPLHGEAATGGGYQVALGALHALRHRRMPKGDKPAMIWTELRLRAEKALEAAQEYNASVRGPFVFEELCE